MGRQAAQMALEGRFWCRTAVGRQGPSSNDVSTPLQTGLAVGGRAQAHGRAGNRSWNSPGRAGACWRAVLTCGAAIDLSRQFHLQLRARQDGQRRETEESGLRLEGR